MAIGGYVGALFGGPLGAVLGVVLGDKVERAAFKRPASRRKARRVRSPLSDAYAVLGAREGDSTDELKRRYRELAKRNHPDALRAQGLSEERIAKATERMSRINAAWAAIREARGL